MDLKKFEKHQFWHIKDCTVKKESFEGDCIRFVIWTEGETLGYFSFYYNCPGWICKKDIKETNYQWTQL